MKENGVYNGVRILRHSVTGLKRLNKKVNWMVVENNWI